MASFIPKNAAEISAADTHITNISQSIAKLNNKISTVTSAYYHTTSSRFERNLTSQIAPHCTAASNPSPSAATTHYASPIEDTQRKRVKIIATGGTIVMAPTEVEGTTNGPLRPQKGFVHNVLKTFTEINHRDMPMFDVLEWENPIDSSDVTPDDLVKLALQIKDNYYLYDGFVILTGTDTMAYIASQLSFLLENLSKTIVLTGAMIPLNEPVSDAKRNLLVSMIVAANLNLQEVLIFFNTYLLRGNRAKKTDPWRIAAFESPSAAPIATMGVGIHVNTKELLPPPSRKFCVHTRLFTNILVLTVTPSFSYGSLRAIAAHWKEYRNSITQTAGLSETDQNDTHSIPRYNTYPDIIEPPAILLLLYGSGNAPIKHKEFTETLDALLVQGCPVVALSQCLKGSTSLDTYEGGTLIKSKGVIDGLDMTVEACTAKLSYLMGRGIRGEQLKNAMEMNLRGELTKKESISYSGYSSLGGGSASDLARL